MGGIVHVLPNDGIDGKGTCQGVDEMSSNVWLVIMKGAVVEPEISHV